MKWLKNEQGVSLIELITSIVVLSVLVLVLSNFYADSFFDYQRNFVQTSLQENTKQALDTVTRDVNLARLVENANSVVDPNRALGWNSTTASAGCPSCITPGAPPTTSPQPATLVLAVPAQDAFGNLIYKDSLHNAPVINSIVIYYDIASQSLYKRVIADTTAYPPGGVNAAQTTCSVNSTTPSCPAGTLSDIKIVENVANMGLQYYDNTTNSLVTDPGSSGSVVVILEQRKTVYGRTYNNVFSSRSTLRNK